MCAPYHAGSLCVSVWSSPLMMPHPWLYVCYQAALCIFKDPIPTLNSPLSLPHPLPRARTSLTACQDILRSPQPVEIWRGIFTLAVQAPSFPSACMFLSTSSSVIAVFFLFSFLSFELGSMSTFPGTEKGGQKGNWVNVAQKNGRPRFCCSPNT